MTTRTIDCTPTWEAASQIYLAVLENGTEEGKEMAREEILRMARLLDQFKADSKEVV